MNGTMNCFRIFGVPRALLPEGFRLRSGFWPSQARAVLGIDIPITGVAGDQQAAAIGQGCFAVGRYKIYIWHGLFCFAEYGHKKNYLKKQIADHDCLPAWTGKHIMRLKVRSFVAGAAVQWLRDEMGLIKTAAETEGMARGLDSNNGLYLVPAFTGLGAPHWDPNARGGIFGITRATGPADFVRAALESVCYQTHDLLAAMEADGARPSALKVDGGMAANDWTMQFLSDILGIGVNRPANMETTALGAALLAGHYCGLYGGVRKFSSETDKSFIPDMGAEERKDLLAGWSKAVGRVLS